MAASPVKFLFGFLSLSVTLWLLFIFASRLMAWILSRILGASVGFRVGGGNGPVESISVGEVRLSIRQSLVKLGVGFFSRDPKLQVLICDLEIVMRPSSRGTKKTKTQRPRSRSSGRGKWMVLANVARFLSVSVTDLAVKTPKATIDVKELGLDISKDGGSKPNLYVKLNILPVLIHMGEPRIISDQMPNFNNGGCLSSGEVAFGNMDRSSAAFFCEELSLSCEFNHDREVGVIIQNVDINSGEVTVNLNEELLSRKKSSSDAFAHTDKELVADSSVSKNQHNKQSKLVAITKYTSMFPEKLRLLVYATSYLMLE
ncbi:hypothetical protein NC651_005939 [Populus alba x Populus x berolinensis]|nr:hypothetical protein NC651_005939 [Populus alba x Populus x berolinensis]